MTFSGVGMCIAMVSLATIEYINIYYVPIYSMTSTILLIISSSAFILFHSIGFNVIPMILLGELCPVQLKSLTSGIVMSLVAILTFAVVKIFPIAIG